MNIVFWDVTPYTYADVSEDKTRKMLCQHRRREYQVLTLRKPTRVRKRHSTENP
jgi:hypothetical protein